MKLIVISNPVPVKNEAKIITTFFEEGLEYFHLRKPGMSAGEMDSWLVNIPEIFHNKIILHSYYKLIDKYDLKGIHFNQWYKNKIYFKNRDKNNIHRSISFHSLEEVQSCKKKYEYVFLGPVFKSISKNNLTPKDFNPKELRDTLNISKSEVIALGGISPDKISLVSEYGFKGVAVLGCIWNAKDTLSAFSNIKDTCNRFPN